MGKERTHAGRRSAHLRIVTDTDSQPQPQPAATPPAASAEEARVLEQVARELRRSARMLPGRSPLRAELLEIAEYFEVGADLADATGASAGPSR
jgi:hypothetical protein